MNNAPVKYYRVFVNTPFEKHVDWTLKAGHLLAVRSDQNLQDRLAQCIPAQLEIVEVVEA